jgi:hypothetical protein
LLQRCSLFFRLVPEAEGPEPKGRLLPIIRSNSISLTTPGGWT